MPTHTTPPYSHLDLRDVGGTQTCTRCGAVSLATVWLRCQNCRDRFCVSSGGYAGTKCCDNPNVTVESVVPPGETGSRCHDWA